MIVSAWTAATSRSAASAVSRAAQNKNGAACKLSMLVSVLPTCAVSWMRTSIRAAASLHEVDVIA
jgi:hypothetical protein